MKGTGRPVPGATRIKPPSSAANTISSGATQVAPPSEAVGHTSKRVAVQRHPADRAAGPETEGLAVRGEKGLSAPSVPGSGRASLSSRARR